MIEAIQNHRSIRKFKNTPVSQSDLNEILDAGIRASNTGNMQLYSIIVSQDKAKKEQLWASHFKQNMVTQAPVVLTFCADINRFNKWCDLRNAEHGYDNFLWFYTASVDAIIAAQNASLEAENKGMGICYLGTTIYMAEKIIDILELPKGVFPVTTVVLGYPDENPTLTERLPRKAVVHHESYKNYSNQDINELYAEKESLEVNKQFVAENKVDNLAQVFTKVRYQKSVNEEFSAVLRKMVQKQGYRI